MKALSSSKTGFAVALFCTAITIAVSAQTLNTLANFNKADGDNPTFLVQGSDGNLYGAAYYGGNSSNCPLGLGCGTTFPGDAIGNADRAAYLLLSSELH